MFQEGYERSGTNDSGYPVLAEGVLTTASGETVPAYSYGFEVTSNGRLIVYLYGSGDEGIGQTGRLGFGLVDATRFFGTGAQITNPQYSTQFQTDMYGGNEQQYGIFMSLGFPTMQGLSDYMNNPEALSILDIHR